MGPVVRKHITADHSHFHDEPENKTEGRGARGEERKEDRRETEGDREKRDQGPTDFFKDTPTNDLWASC